MSKQNTLKFRVLASYMHLQRCYRVLPLTYRAQVRLHCDACARHQEHEWRARGSRRSTSLWRRIHVHRRRQKRRVDLRRVGAVGWRHSRLPAWVKRHSLCTSILHTCRTTTSVLYICILLTPMKIWVLAEILPEGRGKKWVNWHKLRKFWVSCMELAYDVIMSKFHVEEQLP